jgi:hypothetical protein
MFELGSLHFQVLLGDKWLLLTIALGASSTAKWLARRASSCALDVRCARELRCQGVVLVVEVNAKLDLRAVVACLQ